MAVMNKIDTSINSKYGTYEKVFRYNGQEFPVLRNLLGKIVVLRNGDEAIAVQAGNIIVLYIDGKKVSCTFGRRLSAYSVACESYILNTWEPTFRMPQYDIMLVKDAFGNVYWERAEHKAKEKPVEVSECEVNRLLSELGYNKKVKVVSGKGRGRKGTTIATLLKSEKSKEAAASETKLEVKEKDVKTA